MPGKSLRYQPPAPRNRAASPAKSTPSTAIPVPSPPRWFSIRNQADGQPALIELYGYIGEAQSYRDYYGEMVDNPEGAGTLQEFAAELEALGAVDQIELRIFSHGGDVYTGVAMHNLLARHPANKIAVIDGLCASSATFPAMACDDIRIPSNAWMMVHTASIGVYGTAEELRYEADRLDATNLTIANLYAARTGKSADEMMAIMEDAKYLSGSDAVAMGLADTLIEPVKNLASRVGSLEPTNCSALAHAPAEVLALFDTRSGFFPTRQHPQLSPMNQNTAPSPAPAPAASPASPAPASEPAPAPAPVNQAPTPAPASAPVPTPPAPAPAGPLNATDIAGIVSAAVTNAVKPLADRLDIIEGQQKAGITPQNLAGSTPTPQGVQTQTEGAPSSPVNFDLPAAQLIKQGRETAMKRGAAAPFAH